MCQSAAQHRDKIPEAHAPLKRDTVYLVTVFRDLSLWLPSVSLWCFGEAGGHGAEPVMNKTAHITATGEQKGRVQDPSILIKDILPMTSLPSARPHLLMGPLLLNHSSGLDWAFSVIVGVN